MGTVLCFGVTTPALRFDIGTKNPGTFGILATDKLRRGGQFGDKSGDSSWIYFGEGTFRTEISGSAREPNEATTCIEDQMQSLLWSTKAEWSGVSSIAMGGERGLENRVGFGGFDLMGSGLGRRGEESESLEWIWRRKVGKRVERESDGIGVGNGGKRGEEEEVEERERGRRSHGRRLLLVVNEMV